MTTKAIGFRDFALAYARAAATIFCACSSFSPKGSLLYKIRDGLRAHKRRFVSGPKAFYVARLDRSNARPD